MPERDFFFINKNISNTSSHSNWDTFIPINVSCCVFYYCFNPFHFHLFINSQKKCIKMNAVHEPIVCGWENHRMIYVWFFHSRIHRSFCFSLLIPTIFICASSFLMTITLSGKIQFLFYYYYNHRWKKSLALLKKPKQKQKSNQISPYEWWIQWKSKQKVNYSVTSWRYDNFRSHTWKCII